MTVTTEDQIKITSLYLPSADSEKLLIYFHDNAGNIYQRATVGAQFSDSSIF